MKYRCSVCEGPLWWRPSVRRYFICGDCLPEDGLPSYWRKPSARLSADCRIELTRTRKKARLALLPKGSTRGRPLTVAEFRYTFPVEWNAKDVKELHDDFYRETTRAVLATFGEGTDD